MILILHDLLQGELSFTSDGLGNKSTFYFELPLFSETAVTADLNVESIAKSTTARPSFSSRLFSLGGKLDLFSPFTTKCI